MTREKIIKILERKSSIPNEGETWNEIDNAYNEAIKILKQEPRSGNKMNDDLISRQAAIDYLLDALYDLDEADYVDKEFIEEELKRVPSVQPKQKTGQWIYKERNILINTGRVYSGEDGTAIQEKRWLNTKKPYCSECGWYENSEYEATPYCPNCGAKMEEIK